MRKTLKKLKIFSKSPTRVNNSIKNLLTDDTKKFIALTVAYHAKQWKYIDSCNRAHI